MVKIFTLDGDDITLSRDEILLHKEFEVLYKKKLKMKGDAYGKKKLKNMMIFKFIYFMCDYQSPYFEAGLPYKTKFLKSVKEAGLDKGFKIDDDIERAMIKYEDLQNTSSIRLLRSLLKGLNMSSDTVEYLTESMQGWLDEIRDIDPNTDNQLDKDSIEEKINKLMGNIGKLQSIAKTVPDQIEQLEKTRKKVRIEMSEKREKSGGGEIGSREMPNYRKRIVDENTIDESVEIEVDVKKLSL